MRKLSRRYVLKTGGASVMLAALPGTPRASTRAVMNDASRLNPTPVHRHWIVKPNEDAALIESLRAELKAATAEKRPVAVSAARHSMGGQSLPLNGTAITLENPRVEPDTARKTYLVNAGTRWRQVIKALDPIGFSPAVMQSNNDFGVASTFAVNAHGWPIPYGPFGATVKRIEMMMSDGQIVSCSRNENAELFRLSMGGYGLFGIILKLEVEMTENRMMRPSFQRMPVAAFAQRFTAAAVEPKNSMLYGRLSVATADLMKEALLVTYAPVDKAKAPLPAATSGGFSTPVTRKVYRAQVGSEAGKRARWVAETVVGPKFDGPATRNSLMNEPAANLASSDRSRTDILHEYFMPADRFMDYVKACQELIPRSGQEFLNVTLRYVAQDDESVMSFARTPRIAAVMSFSQMITPEGEAGMLKLTEALIDRVGAAGGSFYLPYRLHARRDQLLKIYPNTQTFVARKRHYDPGLLFRNALWAGYLADFA